MSEGAPWESEELEKWRDAPSETTSSEDTASLKTDWSGILSKSPRLQWTAIAIVNVIAVLFYFEIIFFPYRLFNVAGFELVMRCLFSDLIAEAQRTKRNFPLLWWLVAFIFPLPTLIYIYFFPFEKDRPQGLQRKYDACYVVFSLLYWAATSL